MKQPGIWTLTEDERRVLAVWAADCAQRVLHLFEGQAPEDKRPREAIDGLRAFAWRELKIGPLKAHSVQAHAAARAVKDPAAVAAARAAAQGAATAHMGAHAMGAAAYAIIAVRIAGPDLAVVQAESAWQLEHASPDVSALLRRFPMKRRAGEIGNRVVDLQEAVLAADGRASSRDIDRPIL